MHGAQDFGFSPDTHFAGGANKGELGGIFWRTATPARVSPQMKRL